MKSNNLHRKACCKETTYIRLKLFGKSRRQLQFNPTSRVVEAVQPRHAMGIIEEGKMQLFSFIVGILMVIMAIMSIVIFEEARTIKNVLWACGMLFIGLSLMVGERP